MNRLLGFPILAALAVLLGGCTGPKMALSSQPAPTSNFATLKYERMSGAFGMAKSGPSFQLADAGNGVTYDLSIGKETIAIDPRAVGVPDGIRASVTATVPVANNVQFIGRTGTIGEMTWKRPPGRMLLVVCYPKIPIFGSSDLAVFARAPAVEVEAGKVYIIKHFYRKWEKDIDRFDIQVQ